MAVYRTARPLSIRPSLTVFNPWPLPNMFSLELSSQTLAGRKRSKNPNPSSVRVPRSCTLLASCLVRVTMAIHAADTKHPQRSISQSKARLRR
jgi:hypothetical protein